MTHSVPKAALIDELGRRRQDLYELCAELIRIPTENPPGKDYGRAVELICARLEQLGFTDTRVEGECVLSIYILLAGEAIVTKKRTDGKQVRLDIIQRGDLVGEVPGEQRLGGGGGGPAAGVVRSHGRAKSIGCGDGPPSPVATQCAGFSGSSQMS